MYGNAILVFFEREGRGLVLFFFFFDLVVDEE